MQLSTYLLENFYSNIIIWVVTKKDKIIVYGTCNDLFNHCGKYILDRKVLKIETDENFGDINIYINM